MDPAMTDDPIAALRERIRATAQAADRLAEQAASAGAPGRAGAGPAGATGAGPDAEDAAREARALAALFALLHDALPEDLRRQIVDLVRQVLLLVRAVLDQVLLRLEAPAASGTAEPVVEDIPVR